MASERFLAGKVIAAKALDIRAASARVTRTFKANEIVDESDLDLIEDHVKSIRASVLEWNNIRRRELGHIIKTK